MKSRWGTNMADSTITIIFRRKNFRKNNCLAFQSVLDEKKLIINAFFDIQMNKNT